MGEREYLRADYGGGGGGRSPFWATYPATKAIIIGLVAIHVLMAILAAASESTYYAVRHILLLDPEYVLKKFYVWQLVTYALLHAQDTIWHVAFNALMIFFFGRMVEQRLGLKRYLYFCLAATVCSSLAFLAESVIRDQIHPMLGASGCAMGLTILAACWYPRTTVLVFFVIPAPLWALAAILVVVDFVTMLSMPGGIAHSAHLGGALYGFLYFKYGGRIEGVFRSIDAMADKQRAKKEQQRSAREADLRREVDRILDKVNREGMAALTKEERRFLKEASEKLR
ncbi:MAG: rhomboid family intramembrane serine protease [Planctomycetota bacterium]|jgi:membrane associated rhomboid family serine protease